jgi:hypothetical protein
MESLNKKTDWILKPTLGVSLNSENRDKVVNLVNQLPDEINNASKLFVYLLNQVLNPSLATDLSKKVKELELNNSGLLNQLTQLEVTANLTKLDNQELNQLNQQLNHEVKRLSNELNQLLNQEVKQVNPPLKSEVNPEVKPTKKAVNHPLKSEVKPVKRKGLFSFLNK